MELKVFEGIQHFIAYWKIWTSSPLVKAKSVIYVQRLITFVLGSHKSISASVLLNWIRFFVYKLNSTTPK